MKNFFFFILIMILLVIAGAYLLNLKKEHERGSAVVCSMEAMECSDGSYVGRIPPNCEFAPCP